MAGRFIRRERSLTLTPLLEACSIASNFLLMLPDSIRVSSCSVVVGFKSCCPSPNQQRVHQRCRQLMLCEGAVEMQPAITITVITLGITATPLPYWPLAVASTGNPTLCQNRDSVWLGPRFVSNLSSSSSNEPEKLSSGNPALTIHTLHWRSN